MLKFLLTFAVAMNLNADIMTHFLKRKLATTLLIGVSIAAFATLGEGGKKNATLKDRNLLSLRSAPLNYKNFSLKSGSSFRTNTFLNNESSEKVIMLNTVMTYQKGNATYILPLKKKLLLGKVTFKPMAPQR
jgi:hypothetical protein